MVIKMQIKMIAMDMDGTLLKSDDTISQQTKDLLIELQKKGTKLVLASGRSHRRMLQYAKELQMDQYGGWLVEVNGIATYDVANNKRYVNGRMPIEDAQKLMRYFQQYQVEIIGNLDAEMFVYIPEWMMSEKLAYCKEHQLPSDHPLTGGAFKFVYDARNGYPDIYYIQRAEELIKEVNKICITYHPEVIEKVEKQVRKDLGNDYWLGLTSPKWLEVMMKNISKGHSLQQLMQKFDIDAKDVIAFGDGENDLEMIQSAGIGIAMGNALDVLKQQADKVTLSNNEDGIYFALTSILDEK